MKMSINGKFVYSIELDTMQDAKDMVAIATKLKGKILLKSGTRFTINAKSLLGVKNTKKLKFHSKAKFKLFII